MFASYFKSETKTECILKLFSDLPGSGAVTPTLCVLALDTTRSSAKGRIGG